MQRDSARTVRSRRRRVRWRRARTRQHYRTRRCETGSSTAPNPAPRRARPGNHGSGDAQRIEPAIARRGQTAGETAGPPAAEEAQWHRHATLRRGSVSYRRLPLSSLLRLAAYTRTELGGADALRVAQSETGDKGLSVFRTFGAGVRWCRCLITCGLYLWPHVGLARSVAADHDAARWPRLVALRTNIVGVKTRSFACLSVNASQCLHPILRNRTGSSWKSVDETALDIWILATAVATAPSSRSYFVSRAGTLQHRR